MLLALLQGVPFRAVRFAQRLHLKGLGFRQQLGIRQAGPRQGSWSGQAPLQTGTTMPESSGSSHVLAATEQSVTSMTGLLPGASKQALKVGYRASNNCLDSMLGCCFEHSLLKIMCRPYWSDHERKGLSLYACDKQ